jgi:hypothetical protein
MFRTRVATRDMLAAGNRDAFVENRYLDPPGVAVGFALAKGEHASLAAGTLREV